MQPSFTPRPATAAHTFCRTAEVIKNFFLCDKEPFKNYVIPLLKVVFGCMYAPFAAMMIQTNQVGVKPTVRIHSAMAAL